MFYAEMAPSRVVNDLFIALDSHLTSVLHLTLSLRNISSFGITSVPFPLAIFKNYHRYFSYTDDIENDFTTETSCSFRLWKKV